MSTSIRPQVKQQGGRGQVSARGGSRGRDSESIRSMPARRGRGGRQFGALLTDESSASVGDSLQDPPQETGAQDSGKQLTISGSQVPGQPNDHAKEKKAKKSTKQNPAQASCTDSTPTHPADLTASKGKHKAPASTLPTQNNQSEICLICAEPIKYFALGECSHRTCHICSLRMRALYKKRDCALCKTHLPQVVFTTQAETPFSNYVIEDLPYKDPHLSIYCETFEQLHDLLAHLKFNCPHPECPDILLNWRDLKSHTVSAHDLVLCDLCCSNKKIFAHEHTLFTRKAIAVHKHQGSVGIGKGIRGSGLESQAVCVADDGFVGHPKCEFCNRHFYDDDQLYQHCREKHEQCFICVRNGTGRWQYYLDYQHLEDHFRKDHHLCAHSDCLQLKFIVFETAVELQTHQIEAHKAELGSKALKDARKLPTSFLPCGTSESHTHRPNHDGVIRQQERSQAVMNIAPIGNESAPNISDANRRVPGLGTASENSRKQNKQKGKLRATATERPGSQDQASSATRNSDNQAQTGGKTIGQDLKLARYTALLQRVSEAVDGSETKITAFKVSVRTYRNHEMSGYDFLNSLFHVFNHDPTVIGSMLNNLVDILDVDDDEKSQLLRLWSDLRLQQFPSLTGQSSASVPKSISNYSGISITGLQVVASNSNVWPTPHASSSSSKPQKAAIRPQVGYVPGLMAKPSKGGSHSTPWSTSSNKSQATTTPTLSSNGPATLPASNRAPSGPAQTTSKNFPSLPTNPTALERQLKIKEVMTRNNSNPSTIIAYNNTGRTNTVAINQWSSVATSRGDDTSLPVASNKKSKKKVIFTNAR